MRLPKRLSPREFPRIPLHLEVLVAFGAAEIELLRVVAHEGYAF